MAVRFAAPCAGCPAGCLGSSRADRVLRLPARTVPLPAGAAVRVAVPRAGLTRATALILGAPLSAALAAALLGGSWWGDPGAALAALATLPVAALAVTFASAAVARWVMPELVALPDEHDD